MQVPRESINPRDINPCDYENNYRLPRLEANRQAEATLRLLRAQINNDTYCG